MSSSYKKCVVDKRTSASSESASESEKDLFERRSSTTSSDFESAVEGSLISEESRKMSGDDPEFTDGTFEFENSIQEPESGNEMTNDLPTSGSAAEAAAQSNSEPITDEEREALWKLVPAPMREVCKIATGLLHMERYESFIYNQWPYDVKKGHLCHPRALAFAGLAFHSLEPSPTAQCQVCLKVFSDLQPNSNPWIMHSEACPDCYLVTLGQRDVADDYTSVELLEMAFRKVMKMMDLNYEKRENSLKKVLAKLSQIEQKKKKKQKH